MFDVSQASPIPSPSASAWSVFGTVGQLSGVSGIVSRSVSGGGAWPADAAPTVTVVVAVAVLPACVGGGDADRVRARRPEGVGDRLAGALCRRRRRSSRTHRRRPRVRRGRVERDRLADDRAAAGADRSATACWAARRRTRRRRRWSRSSLKPMSRQPATALPCASASIPPVSKKSSVFGGSSGSGDAPDAAQDRRAAYGAPGVLLSPFTQRASAIPSAVTAARGARLSGPLPGRWTSS